MSTAPHSKEFRSQRPESTIMSPRERDAADVIHPDRLGGSSVIMRVLLTGGGGQKGAVRTEQAERLRATVQERGRL